MVLQGLRLAPFEPLDTVGVQSLMLKTLFLTALASLARVSELAALSAEQGFIPVKDDKSEVSGLASCYWLRTSGYQNHQRSTLSGPSGITFKWMIPETTLSGESALRLPADDQ